MRKHLLLVIISLLTCFSVRAANDAVYVWVDGTATCYQLESYPLVTFEGTTAVLTLQGETSPVLKLDLVGNAELKMTFGEYVAAVENIDADTCVQQDGKYIRGGRLVIVKNSKQYTPDGKLIH